MNKENPISDTGETEAVVVAENPPPAPIKDDKEPMTPQQMRVMEVSEALAPAYARASTLELNETEVACLTAPFPDSVVEVRPHDGLIYIPHIHISDRLNFVFKPGRWSLICRRHWLEGSTMYGEYILLIKGCYVGESVGGHPYIANNPKTNYSDSLEATAAEALRRICGKRLSCGSQVWDPTYANEWCMKYRFQANGKYYKKMNPMEPTPKKTDKKEKSVIKQCADEADKVKFIKLLENDREKSTQFCIDLAWLMPNEPLKDLPLKFVPVTQGEFNKFIALRNKWEETGVAEKPYPSHIEPEKAKAKEPEEEDTDGDASSEPWYGVIVPIPHKGEKRDEYLKHPDTIGSLYEARHDDEEARKRLWGFINHYEPKGWTKKDGTPMPPSKTDIKFREALDEFMDWFEKSHPDEKL